MKPPRICNVPGCPEIVTNSNGKCNYHRQKAKRAADKRNGRVRGSRWSAIRKLVLQSDPFCACKGCSFCDEGQTPRGNKRCMRPATEVDHITPLAHGGHPTALTNLQGLCHPCHEEKTRSEYHYQLQED